MQSFLDLCVYTARLHSGKLQKQTNVLENYGHFSTFFPIFHPKTHGYPPKVIHFLLTLKAQCGKLIHKKARFCRLLHNKIPFFQFYVRNSRKVIHKSKNTRVENPYFSTFAQFRHYFSLFIIVFLRKKYPFQRGNPPRFS